MSAHGYTRYSARKFSLGRIIRVQRASSFPEAGMPLYMRGEAVSRRVSSGEPAHAAVMTGHAERRLSLARLVKWITTSVLVVALGAVLLVGAKVGYGYLEAWAGQSSLRDLFTITGNGSVDPDYLNSEARAMQAGLNHMDPVGEINIPGIDSRWMIVEGADEAALSKGPGHIEETELPGMGGNFTVAGDRVLYGAPFLHLDEIVPGNIIRVKMPYATFTYRVTETFIVTPEDTSVLEPVGYEAITLLTCDPPWDIKQRIVIRGELDEVEPAGGEI